MSDKLNNLHEDISPYHYDMGIKKNLFQKIWHSRRFNEIAKIITPIKGRILDVGCHSGLLSQKIFQWTGADEIYGVDISKKAVERAQKRIKSGHFMVGDAQNLSFKSNYFDAVFCLEMIEHVDYPEKVLKEIYRVMKKGGYGVILIPTENLLFKIVWFLWNLYYPVWKHVHVQSFNGNLLENMLRKEGFKIVSVKTFNLNMLKLIRVIRP